MATEVITRTYCDLCLAEDTQTDGAPLGVTLDGEASELDACPPHREALTGPLRAALEAFGHEPTKARRPRSPELRERAAEAGSSDTTCQLCGHVSPSRGALRSHLIGGIHKLPRAEANKLMPASPLGRPNVTTVCPVCGVSLASRQGGAAHLFSQHSIRGFTNVPENLKKFAADGSRVNNSHREVSDTET